MLEQVTKFLHDSLNDLSILHFEADRLGQTMSFRHQDHNTKLKSQVRLTICSRDGLMFYLVFATIDSPVLSKTDRTVGWDFLIYLTSEGFTAIPSHCSFARC
jgi:hypothetical protein